MKKESLKAKRIYKISCRLKEMNFSNAKRNVKCFSLIDYRYKML